MWVLVALRRVWYEPETTRSERSKQNPSLGNAANGGRAWTLTRLGRRGVCLRSPLRHSIGAACEGLKPPGRRPCPHPAESGVEQRHSVRARIGGAVRHEHATGEGSGRERT